MVVVIAAHVRVIARGRLLLALLLLAVTAALVTELRSAAVAMNVSNPVGSLLALSAKLRLVRVESANLDIVRADLIDRVGLRELRNKLHVRRKLGE